jgi:hypothetical protein
MATKLVQNTCTHNMRNKIFNNYLRYLTSKKRVHPATNFDNILIVVTKDDSILEF